MKSKQRNIRVLRQRGVAMLEVLIAILVFSFGILGLLGLEANAVRVVLASKNRADASNLVGQMVGQMWADRANLAAYAHNATNGAAACAPTGAASTNANVISWLSQVAVAMPGATAATQQISVGAGNVVTVTVCWKLPQESVTHNFSETAQING